MKDWSIEMPNAPYSNRYALFKMKQTTLIFGILILTSQLFCQVNTTTIDLDSNIKLISKVETFNPLHHEIDSCDTGLGWIAICLIDNKPIFGTDHEIPRSQLIELVVLMNGQEIKLNVDFMYNPNWENNLRKDQFELKKEEVGFSLWGKFSDGAGTYEVQWKIIKDKSFRLLIMDAEN